MKRAEGVHWVEAGDGPPLVLIHGALVTGQDMVLGPFERLARRYRVIAVDRPNHGASGPGDARPLAQAEAIRADLRAAGADRPIVLGHSMGAAVALAWAAHHPEDVAGLVLVAPLAYPELRLEQALFATRLGLDTRTRAQLRDRLDRVAMPAIAEMMFAPQPIPAAWRAAFADGALMREDRHTQAVGVESAFGFAGLARQIGRYPICPVPMRILAGDADRIIDRRRHAWPLALTVPRAHYALLPGLGHMAHHFALDDIAAAVASLSGEAD